MDLSIAAVSAYQQAQTIGQVQDSGRRQGAEYRPGARGGRVATFAKCDISWLAGRRPDGRGGNGFRRTTRYLRLNIPGSIIFSALSASCGEFSEFSSTRKQERRRSLFGIAADLFMAAAVVSRVLFPVRRSRTGRRPFLWDARCRAPQATYPRIDSAPGQGSPLIWSCCRWGLPCRPSHPERGALLPHHFTLTWRIAAVASCKLAVKTMALHSLQLATVNCNYSPGGIFSVALSVGLLRLDVIKHRALCSSDFPHPAGEKSPARRGRRVRRSR